MDGRRWNIRAIIYLSHFARIWLRSGKLVWMLKAGEIMPVYASEIALKWNFEIRLSIARISLLFILLFFFLILTSFFPPFSCFHFYSGIIWYFTCPYSYFVPNYYFCYLPWLPKSPACPWEPLYTPSSDPENTAIRKFVSFCCIFSHGEGVLSGNEKNLFFC